MIVLAAAAILFVVSVIWCMATWSSPGRFIFLPGGDVGFGFRSHAGWLEWVEYVPWIYEPDYVHLMLPWLAVFIAESFVIALCLPRLRQGGSEAPKVRQEPEPGASPRVSGDDSSSKP